MKPTLKEIEDNYEKVLLQLDNGRLAGIKRLRSEDYYVVEQQDWNYHAVAIELSRGYNRESSYGYNIARIKFLDTKNELTDFMDYGSETDITDWDWDINNPQCDDQMDAYKYCMVGTRYNITEIDDIIKGDKQNMMNEILEIYKERRREKINKKYDDMENAVRQCDPRYKVWRECTNTLLKLYEEDKILANAFAPINLSDETRKRLNAIDKTRCEDLHDLSDKLNEVQAQLSMCETYEQKQDILRTYKIIKENGKVNA